MSEKATKETRLSNLLLDPEFDFASFACKKIMWDALQIADDAQFNRDNEKLETLANIVYAGATLLNQMNMDFSFDGIIE